MEIEVKAKSVHEAIAQAAEQLGVSQDQLDVEILSQGGMFGKAKILAKVKPEEKKPEPVFAPTVDPKIEIESDLVKLEKKKDEKKHAPKEAKTEHHEPKAEVVSTPVTFSAPAKAKGDKFKVATEFVKTLLELLGATVTITTEDTETSFNINVSGENIGRLIGKGGHVMNSIQTIVSTIAIANSNGENKRVYINIGDYKEKRVDTLQSMAQKKADYVKRTGRYVKLDPMNSRERAIIHTALQNVEGIKTYSTGKDPFRCLCIAPADGKEAKSTPTEEGNAI